MKWRHQLHWFIYGLFLINCAQQTSPTGGPKDTIPPTVIRTTPPKNEINFKGDQVEILLSETVILNNPKEQLIITPDIEKEYEIEAKKNRVVLTFNKPLKDSTTYLINFRDAVQDITEKNGVKNLKTAFSTGTYIDSLSIQGNVYEALTNKEVKEITVALYQSDTFNIYKHKPTYVTKSDEIGNYLFENLKPGNYYVYAFDDKNKNLVVDGRSESYGYLKNPIRLSTNQKEVNIPTIRVDPRPLKLTSARAYNSYYNIRGTKGFYKYFVLDSLNNTIPNAASEDFTNIKVYNTFGQRDSVAIHFIGRDSINQVIDTTLYAKFSAQKFTPEKFNASFQNMRILEDKGILEGMLKVNKPLNHISYDSMILRIDSIRSVPIKNEHLIWDTLHLTANLRVKFDKALLQPLPISKEDSIKQATEKLPKKGTKKVIKNQLYFADASLISIEMDSSRRMSEDIKTYKSENLSILFVEIQTNEPHFIVQLLSSDYKVVREQKDQSEISFVDLPPSDYQVRLIIDTNGDGEWTAGNFFRNQEPEKVIYYRNEKQTTKISLKANWEVGPLLISTD